MRSQGRGQLSTQQSPGNDTERPLRKVQAWREGWGRCDQPPSGGGKGCLQGIPAPTFQLDGEAVITPPVSIAGEQAPVGAMCGSRHEQMSHRLPILNPGAQAPGGSEQPESREAQQGAQGHTACGACGSLPALTELLPPSGWTSVPPLPAPRLPTPLYQLYRWRQHRADQISTRHVGARCG